MRIMLRMNNKKLNIVLLLSLISVILLILALFVPWWFLKMDNQTQENPMYMEEKYKLREKVWEMKGGGISETIDPETGETVVTEEKYKSTINYNFYRDEPLFNDLINVYDTTYYIVIITIVLGIITLISITLLKIKKISKKIVVTFLITTMILGIFLSLYFPLEILNGWEKDYNDSNDDASDDNSMNYLPQEKSGITKNFAGYEEIYYSEITWGPLYGWYLTIISFVLFGICTIIMLFPSEKEKIVSTVSNAPTTHLNEQIEPLYNQNRNKVDYLQNKNHDIEYTIECIKSILVSEGG